MFTEIANNGVSSFTQAKYNNIAYGFTNPNFARSVVSDNDRKIPTSFKSYM